MKTLFALDGEVYELTRCSVSSACSYGVEVWVNEDGEPIDHFSATMHTVLSAAEEELAAAKEYGFVIPED